MEVIGIIAEYNPFHNGHLYHINKIKERYPNSILIAVISGEFTQRGHISILDKHAKTKICLDNNIDIVVKLPTFYSVQSADLFAYGAVLILNNLKVNKIIIGSEQDNIGQLEKVAKVQLNNPIFEEKVKYYLDQKVNSQTSISSSIKHLLGYTVTEPNDILGVCYLKAIINNDFKISVETIKRTNNFHDNTSNNSIISASNIRHKIENNIDISKYVPASVNDYLNIDKNDNYFKLLKYKIMTNITTLNTFLSVDEGIENKIKKTIFNCNSLEELISSVKNKRYTYNKLTRMFTHILLNIKKLDVEKYKDIDYINILGFNQVGRSHLNTIKKNPIPITSNINKLDNGLERYSTSIYDLIYDYNNSLTTVLTKGIPYIKEVEDEHI